MKNKRVYSVFHNFVGHIFAFAGIQAVAQELYPREFADLSPEDKLREFHARFFPVSYSGVWMMKLE
ncbi:MAG TPA: hypothetical protein PKA28_12035 [Methylomusa anaerophila]|uniref:hypothetical protein n=1 Tax=Methylomusa anaerophila TaxID=1930071 RepID=UPI000F848480|nr:hypothetical protein [Methylomusa anaerophila]HML89160.1 hypothetical protein [Methylomusa anaerophila]